MLQWKPRLFLPALALLAGFLLPLFPGAAYAHGFGERYDLPLPLTYFAVGGGLAVALSFAVIGVFVRGAAAGREYPRLNLLRWGLLRFLLTGPLYWLLRAAALFLFLLVIAAGLLGEQRPVSNLTPTFVWIIWWVGMGFVVSLLGNLWAVVNPWSIIYDLAAGIYRQFRPENEPGPGWAYPAGWGVWPAVGLFFAFAWVENALPDAAAPALLSALIIAYSLLTLAGMYLFGKQPWLRQAEVFSVIYGVLTRFALTEVRALDPELCRECAAPQCLVNAAANRDDSGGRCVDCYECFELAERRELNLRPPAIGLNRRGHGAGVTVPGMTALVLLLLATVTFDGFSDTPEWAAVLGFFLELTPDLTSPYFNGLVLANTLGLLAFPLSFAALYRGFAELTARAVGRPEPAAGDLMAVFVFSLVPIALAYHFAHYLGFLLIQGQLIIPLASDPFGWGWDLFGGAGYVVNIGITNARFIWFFALISIVAGHIIAVWLAHLRAVEVYGERRPALRSQGPLLVLMVLYTVASLWIISRPITE